MKALRFLIILILVLAVAFLVLGLIEPKDVTVSRSATINAPKGIVYNQIVKFKNWPNWSPWYAMDTAAQISYSGVDGTAGSSYHWSGSKKTGEGDMMNKAVKDNEMDYEVHFIKPMSGQGDGSFVTADANGATKVTWTMHSHMSYPMNAFMAFMDMDKMLGKDFEKGLDLMKKYCESHTSNSAGITAVQFPAHSYVGVRKVVAWTDMSKFFTDTYPALGKAAGARITGPAAGLFYTWDTIAHNSDMAAVFPVSGTDSVKGAVMINVPASKAYMAVQKGGYSGSMSTHMALMNYIADMNQKRTLVIEEYLVGPGQEKDSTKWVTNIYYLVQ